MPSALHGQAGLLWKQSIINWVFLHGATQCTTANGATQLRNEYLALPWPQPKKKGQAVKAVQLAIRKTR